MGKVEELRNILKQYRELEDRRDFYKRYQQEALKIQHNPPTNTENKLQQAFENAIDEVISDMQTLDLGFDESKGCMFESVTIPLEMRTFSNESLVNAVIIYLTHILIEDGILTIKDYKEMSGHSADVSVVDSLFGWTKDDSDDIFSTNLVDGEWILNFPWPRRLTSKQLFDIARKQVERMGRNGN